MSKNITTRTTIQNLATTLKATFAKKSALEALQTKVNSLIATGGEANVLEGVQINGTALAIAEKMVNILIATGTANGTLSVNGADVAIAGLQALAYKASISQSDLDTALAAVIAAKAEASDLTALTTRMTAAEGSITTLNGDSSVTGSVAQQVAAAVAQIVADAPEAYDTLKEIADWISNHADSASAMNTQINTNKSDIAALVALIGTLPESAVSTNIVDYIAEAVSAIDLSDYAKTTEVNAAITTALGSYYTKTETDAAIAAALEGYLTEDDISDYTAAEIEALLADDDAT